MTKTVYTPDEIDAILGLVSENPQGFLRLVRKHCPPGREHEVKRSMRAWGIDYSKEQNDQSAGNRVARRRQNSRD